ncbi:MAG: peptide deformylase [bacterium]
MARIITDLNQLKQKSQPVLNVDSFEIQELINLMYKTMGEKGGVGLAAVQVGNPIRIFVVDWKNKKYEFINPQIEKMSDKKEIQQEGCLSVPGVYVDVARSQKISISAVDRCGKKIKLKADGMLARIIQHEFDHLEGILII